MAQHSQSNNKRRTQDICRQIVDAEWRTSVTTIRTDRYFFSNQFSKLKSSSPRRFLAQQSVARLGDKTRDHLQRKNLNEIRDLVLNVSEAYAKTCSAKIVLKIVGASMLHGIILKSNIVALKLVVVNRPVSPW